MSRLRANQITNENANGAPNFPHGLTVTGIITATNTQNTFSNIVVGSAVTANSNGVDTVGIVTAGTLKDKAGGTFAPNPTTTRGDLIVRGVSVNERLPIGTAGKALKVNSSANGLEYGDAGAWTVIASGSGPGAASINIDNIFSDTYYFYKLYYSWSEDDWVKARYIKADGSIESGNVYLASGQWTSENSASGPSRTGHTNQNYAFYSYWNSADDVPGICEIFYVNPYSSTKETIDFYQAAQVEGTRLRHNTGSNCNMNAYAVRGVQLFGNAGDNLTSANFKYLVLGAKI